VSGRLRLIAFLGLAATLFLAGCTHHAFELPTKPVKPAPVPDSPRHALDLLVWCWAHRDYDHCRTLFTWDFRFVFAATDTAGNAYRIIPWIRDDELISTSNMFQSGDSVSLVIDGNLTAEPDPRPGKTYPWHQRIEVSNLTLISAPVRGTWRITGPSTFYFVRGDSANIPPDLGFSPDEHRWYIERWEEGSPAGTIGDAAEHATPGRQLTLGAVKVYYRDLPALDGRQAASGAPD